MFGREPVLIAAALAAILQGVGILWTNDVAFQLLGWEAWLAPLVTLLAGALARRKVVPVKTIEKAGLTPESVKRRAGE